jgi:hypothetical protein
MAVSALDPRGSPLFPFDLLDLALNDAALQAAVHERAESSLLAHVDLSVTSLLGESIVPGRAPGLGKKVRGANSSESEQSVSAGPREAPSLGKVPEPLHEVVVSRKHPAEGWRRTRDRDRLNLGWAK